MGDNPLPVTFSDVAAAARRLDGVVHRTPIHRSSTLDLLTEANVFCKCENFQRAGAFKFRGAYNALSQLHPEDAARGVVTFSSGNHAGALALAGRLLNVNTTVVMPDNAPGVKLDATRGYGATVVQYDPHENVREAIATRMAAEQNLTIIPPYDHPHIVAGQGTSALELLQNLGSLDYLLAPCGGGGLLSGTAIAAGTLSPECRVIGVEPANADDATRSFRTGKLQTVTEPDTIADGARTLSLGHVTFPIVKSVVYDMVTVSEEAILQAMRFLWERMKLVVEPTGSLPVAALLSGSFSAPHKRVGVILSGGNVSLD